MKEAKSTKKGYLAPTAEVFMAKADVICASGLLATGQWPWDLDV